MPFTLAHPAAVLLVRGTPLPVSAMIAGSMAPDAPMFVKARGAYDFTHSLAGVFTVDLALSVVGVALWFALIRDPLLDLMPAVVRERMPATARYTRRQWLLVAPAAVVGSLTHVAWDSFTHNGRWGARHVTWLHQLHHGHSGAEWAQYGCSVVGLLIVAAWAFVWVGRQQRIPRPATVRWLGVRALTVVLVLTITSGLAAALTTGPPGIGPALGQAAVVGTIIGVFAILVVAGLWQAHVRRRRSPGRPSPPPTRL
ncbi:MAG TPA: DUF4184 family protein [Marmoricola sp.]|nr:DUF4184 family protein [Marmoricola sp.]